MTAVLWGLWRPSSRFQRTVLVTKLENVPVIFWQRKKKEREGGRKGKKWLLSTCVLRTCLRLNWTKFGTNFFDRDSKTANIDPIKRSIVITLMQIYNEKEQVGQKEIQNIQFKEKKKARKHVTGLP